MSEKCSEVGNRSPETCLSLANNEFSFKVFKLLSKEGNNSVMSPMSINIAFSILMNGTENETFDDIKTFLEVKTLSELTLNQAFETILKKYFEQTQDTDRDHSYPGNKESAKLFVSNCLVRDKSFAILAEFERTVKQYFLADIKSADFKNNAVEETKKVNQWVSNATNHKITKIFEEIPSDTSLVIINAVYFKGLWLEQFKESQTQKLDFYNNGETSVKTDTMYIDKKFNYFDSDDHDAQFIELNYSGKTQESDLSFVIVLPKQRNGLKTLKSKITADSFRIAMESMRSENIELYLPKFRVESQYDLIREISPKPLFLSPSAQFSRLTPEPQMVSEAIHKVFVEVNEKGTEAAAVTAVMVCKYCMSFPQPSITFRADHPFLYFLRDRSNQMILFMGQIDKF